MIVEAFLPCLLLLGVGLFLLRLVQKYGGLTYRSSEAYFLALTLGSALLVIPWSFLGLGGNESFFQTWPLLVGLVGSVYALRFVYVQTKLFINQLEDLYYPRVPQNWEQLVQSLTIPFVLKTLVAFLILDLVLYQLFLPIRGFDALFMYIPESIWYYRVNTIPPVDLLVFRPIVKEPAHILLFTFVLYTTGNLFIQLLPVLFMVGLALVTYAFVMEQWGDETKALFSMILLLVLPFTNYLFNFWPYYQEIYVAFYFSTTLFAVYKLTHRSLPRNEQLFYLLFGALSLAMSVLAKLNGWILVGLILVLLPFTGKARAIPALVLTGVTAVLVLRAVGFLYWGFAVALVVGFAYLLTLIVKREGNNNTSALVGLLVVPLGVLFGGFWLVESFNRFDSAESSFVQQYMTFVSDQVAQVFPERGLESYNYILESAQSTNFFAVVLFLFVGNFFAVFWLVPKLRALVDSSVAFFSAWAVFVFEVWMVFHGVGSTRYLTPLLVPLVVLVTHGVYLVWADLSKRQDGVPLAMLLGFSSSALLSYYFPIPLETFLGFDDDVNSIGDASLRSAELYYDNTLLVLSLVLLVSGLTLLALKKTKVLLSDHPFTMGQLRFKDAFVVVFCLLIVVFPVAIPGTVLVGLGGDVGTFQTTWEYQNRPAIQEVAEVIVMDDQPLSSIITLNAPALMYLTNQPTLDLFAQRGLLNFFDVANITYLLSLLKDPVGLIAEVANETIDVGLDLTSFDYVVVPNYGNLFYRFYGSNIYLSSPLFSLVKNPNLFMVLHENPEFVVYKRTYQSPLFGGLVDLRLDNNDTTSSIVGKVQRKQTFTAAPFVRGVFDFQMVGGQPINLTVAVKGIEGVNQFWNNRTFDLLQYQLSGLTTFQFPLLPSDHTPSDEQLAITEVVLTVRMSDTVGFLDSEVILAAPETGLVLSYYPTTGQWVLEQGEGLTWSG